MNPHWGEQVHATSDRRLIIEMNYQGMDGAAAQKALKRAQAAEPQWLDAARATLAALH